MRLRSLFFNKFNLLEKWSEHKSRNVINNANGIHLIGMRHILSESIFKPHKLDGRKVENF